MAGDYIKLHRQLIEWEWFTSPITLQVWIYCLIRANWKPGRFKGHEVPRGTFITNYALMSEDLELTTKQIRTAIQHLESTGEISRKRAGNGQAITVVNYGLFQDAGPSEGQTKGRPGADLGQTKGRLRADLEAGTLENKGPQASEERKKERIKESNNYYSFNQGNAIMPEELKPFPNASTPEEHRANIMAQLNWKGGQHGA